MHLQCIQSVIGPFKTVESQHLHTYIRNTHSHTKFEQQQQQQKTKPNVLFHMHKKK